MAKTDKKDEPVPQEVDVNAIAHALSAPFDLAEVKFKPQTVSGNRALAVPFVDARVIQDRLDDVLGVLGWQDSYECLPDGSVVCRLRIRLGAEWITKEDVGGQSEQPDEGDRRKAAFSDALKRAAVKFGIGRYLYRLKPQWVDYDPQRRQFTGKPVLPTPAHPVAPSKEAREERASRSKPPVAESARPEPAPEPASKAGRGLPANGAELQKRLYDYDARLASEGVIQPGELVKHIVAAGQKAGHDRNLEAWTGAAIQLAIEETRAYENRVRQKLVKVA